MKVIRFYLLIVGAVFSLISHWPAEEAHSTNNNHYSPLKIGVASMITPVDAVKYY